MDPLNSSTNTAGSFSPHWKFLGTTLWGILVAGFFLLFQIITTFVLVAIQKNYLTEGEFTAFMDAAGENGVLLSIATFVTTILCSALVVGIVKLRRGALLADYLAFRLASFQTLATWLGVTAVFIVASDGLTLLLGRPLLLPHTKRLIRSGSSG